MTELEFEVSEDPEGGYTARALGESIFTEADDLAGLKAMIRDAVHCHFDKNVPTRMIATNGARVSRLGPHRCFKSK